MTAGVAPPRNASVGLCLGAGLNRRGARRSDADRPARRRLSCKASCRTTRPAPTLSWPAKVAAHQGVESAVLGRPASQVSTTPACAPAEIFGRPVMKIMKTYRLRARRGHRDMALMVMPVTSAAGGRPGSGCRRGSGGRRTGTPIAPSSPSGSPAYQPSGSRAVPQQQAVAGTSACPLPPLTKRAAQTSTGIQSQKGART